MTLRVLLVENDAAFAGSVLLYLETNHVLVDPCSNGKQALNLLQTNNYDVVISAINMPKMSGYSLCKKIRDNGINVPFIFVSSKARIEDKLEAFSHGGDDYLCKPFDVRELFARVKALSCRRSGQSSMLSIDEISLTLNFNQRIAKRNEQLLKLTPSGWKMLAKLVRCYPEPVSKSELEFAIWGDELPDSDALKVHIFNLRKSLDKPFNFPILKVVSSYGFRLAQC